MDGIVITGATGTIGISLLKICIKEKINVLVLTHKNSPRNKYIPISTFVKVIECNLNELNSLRITAAQTYDTFYHFGWIGGYQRDEVHLQKNNVQYTLDAVELAARLGCKTFIGAGSQAEYGIISQPLNADTPTFPTNAFGSSKLYAGHISKILAHQLGLRHIWTRILSIYGPYDGERTMVISTIEKLLDSQKPSFTLGEQKWDYLFSDDAAKAMLLIGEKGQDGKIYCIGKGTSTPLKDYVIQIRDAINPELPLGIGEIPYSSGQVMNLCADITDLKSDTGFEPETEFYDGIRKTINWVIEKRKNNENG